jgi:hypothetical protein
MTSDVQLSSEIDGEGSARQKLHSQWAARKWDPALLETASVGSVDA